MFKFLSILTAVFFSTIYSFDVTEFQRKHCHEDTNVSTTASYFPYLSKWVQRRNGYVCENFVLTKEDLNSMSEMDFAFSNMDNIFLKNCEIAYFNQVLVSKFPKTLRIDLEHCQVSFKTEEPETTQPNKLFELGFYKCNLTDHSNTSALQSLEKMNLILFQSTTFQYPQIDQYFLPKKQLKFILLDKTNIRGFVKEFSATHSLSDLRITSSDLNETDSVFNHVNLEKLESFSFAKNQITKLPSTDILSKCRSLKNIDLSGNRITEPLLTRDHFKSLTSLVYLTLSRNPKITSIGKLAFADTALKELFIHHVNLEFLDKLGCPTLTDIDFSYNQISDIGLEVFEDLTNLLKLDLGHNMISKLEAPIFKSLGKLKELKLHSNRLKELPNDVFKSLTRLKILDIRCNPIDEFENLQDLVSRSSSLKIFTGSSQCNEIYACSYESKVVGCEYLMAGHCTLKSSNGLFAKNTETNEIVQSGGVLNQGSSYVYHCPSEHILLGAQRDICIRGELFSVQNPPSCSKYCTNEVLKSVTAKAVCKYKKIVIDCKETILTGTTADFECQTNYVEPAVQINSITCKDNGKWDNEPYPCVPACGITPASQKQFIYGGYETSITNVPWQAAIYRMSGKGRYKHICGGSIVTAKLIVTAAHCLWDRNVKKKMESSLFAVAVGKTRRDYYVEDTDYSPQFSNISEFRIGRYFEADSLAFINDIAVIVLNTAIVFKRFIVPICWDRSTRFKDITSNLEGRIAGWGRDETGKPSTTLKFINLPSISNSECQSRVSEDYKTSIVADKFCVSSDNPGNSLCDGDSGGGFAVKRMSKYYLEGVVSTGLKPPEQECGGNYYVTMTNINHHIDLISDLEKEFRVY